MGEEQHARGNIIVTLQPCASRFLIFHHEKSLERDTVCERLGAY
jgi:hypothetical protein